MPDMCPVLFLSAHIYSHLRLVPLICMLKQGVFRANLIHNPVHRHDKHKTEYRLI